MSDLSYMFLIFPSRGSFRRTFVVPAYLISQEDRRVLALYASHSACELSFSDKSGHPVLYALAQRMGIVDSGDNADLREHEHFADAVMCPLAGFLIGNCD